MFRLQNVHSRLRLGGGEGSLSGTTSPVERTKQFGLIIRLALSNGVSFVVGGGVGKVVGCSLLLLAVRECSLSP